MQKMVIETHRGWLPKRIRYVSTNQPPIVRVDNTMPLEQKACGDGRDILVGEGMMGRA
jgi:hypothetical protein